MKRISFVALFSIISWQTAQAISFPEWNANLPPPPSEYVEAGGNYNFEGIVALSNCSGSIVRFDDSKNTDKAMVLTNGHCVGMLDPGEVRVDIPSNKSFNVLNKTAVKIGTITAQKLIYATMTKTDAGLYELKETYQDIISKYSINALTMARTSPELNSGIEVISGYWKKGYTCRAEAIVHQLKEGDWLMEKSIRYSRPGCDTIGGTSGSPVIAAGTRTVVAVNNTGNESGYECTENNPCEIDENGNITFEKGFSYAQQTYWFYTCRNSNGKLDLSVNGCLLQKP